MVALFVWMLALTVGNQMFAWLVDQTVFEGILLNYTSLRFGIALVYALALLFPLLFSRNRLRASPYAPVYWTWLWAAVFIVLVAPVRLASLTDFQLANCLQILGAAVYIFWLQFWLRRSHEPDLRAILIPSRRGLPLVFLLCGVLAVPWVLWGALGSPLDSLLNLVAALLLGGSAALTLGILPKEYPPASGPSFPLIVLAAMLTLAVMATGFGNEGLAWVLAFCLPVLGWLLAELARSGSSAGQTGGWLWMAALIGLAAAIPLMGVDPLGLTMILNADPKQLVYWVNLGLVVTVSLEVLAGIALVFLRPRIQRLVEAPNLVWAALLVWLAVFGAYFLSGQPGFYGDRLFVIMKSQADVSAAANMKDYDQRRAYVYQTLVDQANTTQAPLRAVMDRLHIAYTPYYLVNGIEVQGGPLIRAWLSSQPEVDRVLNNPELRPLPEASPANTGDQPAPTSPPWNLTLIGADRVWGELGITGQGIVVGQSDTGVQGDHPDLSGNYRGLNGQNDYNWYDPWYGSSAPVDASGHGTHTLGIAVGKTTGIAPGSTWFGCVNLARDLGNPAYYLDCMQFMLAPFPEHGDPLKDGDPTRSANVINNSWGCPWIEGCDADALLPAVQALRAAGIFVVASAGNDGDTGCGTVRDPIALYKEVYSVGAIDSDNQLASFSSLGPVIADGSDRVKPDIVAPGVDVLSAYPGSTYEALSGTSMAGPEVVGVVALMWSANPALIGDISQTEAILDKTAAPYTGKYPTCVNGQATPNDGVGYGRLDAYAAVKMALEAK